MISQILPCSRLSFVYFDSIFSCILHLRIFVLLVKLLIKSPKIALKEAAPLSPCTWEAKASCSKWDRPNKTKRAGARLLFHYRLQLRKHVIIHSYSRCVLTNIGRRCTYYIINLYSLDLKLKLFVLFHTFLPVFSKMLRIDPARAMISRIAKSFF